MTKEIKRKQRLEAFLADPDLTTLTQWERSINFFDIIGLSETRVSSFIAWLINPKESHGLGDRCLKRLLIEVFKASKANTENAPWKAQITDSLGSIFDIDSSAYSEAMVFCEYPSPTGKDRIDIVIIDENEGLAIFIENKYGAKLSKDQLKKYHGHFNAPFKAQDFNNIFIYLDDIEEHIEENWIHLDYEWLYAFLNSTIKHESISGPAQRIVKDFLYCVEDCTLDERYGESWQTLKRLYRTHRNFLNDIRAYKSEKDKTIAEIVYTDILPTAYSSYDYWIFKAYQSHLGVITTLIDMSGWDPIYEAILERTGSDSLVDQKKLQFFFTTNDADLLTENGNFDFWPVEVGIRKKESTYESFIKVHQAFRKFFEDEIDEAYNDRRERKYYVIQKTDTPAENTKLIILKVLRLYDLLEERTAGRLVDCD